MKAALPALLVLLACTTHNADLAQSGGTIQSVGVLELQESDTAFVALPTGLLVTSTGDVLVSDGLTGRVLRFDSAGTLTGVIGRKGRGPGELQVPGAAAIMSDSLLLVTDLQLARLTAFTLDSGTYRRTADVQGVPYGIAVAADTALIGALGRGEAPGAVARWQPWAQRVTPRGTVPSVYRASAAVRSVHPYVSVARLGSRLLIGFTGTDALLDTIDFSPMQVLRVPATRRRPMPTDIAARLQSGLTDSAIAAMGSALVSLHTLDSARALLVHMDVRPGRNSFDADSWVTVLDVLRRRACVDLAVPTAGTGKPVFYARGDTIWVTEQRMKGERPVSRVARFRIDTSQCDWQDVAGAVVLPDSTAQ